jgi:hypothetical protein
MLMKRLKRRAGGFLVLGIFSVISAVAGTPLLAWAMLKGWYACGVPLVVLVAHGFYGMPLYFSARYRARLDFACVEAMSRLKRATLGELAMATGLTDKAARTRALKCVKRGYLKASETGGESVFEYVE